MTNPPPVAPVEKHYALLQNGTVIRHLSRCEYNADIYRSPMIANCFWHSDGRCFVEHPSNGPEPWSHADIIATISPADMQAVASGELERLRAERANLIAACDSVLDWADANARWFDISTAPLNGGSSAKFQILYEGGHFEDAWSYAGKIWVADQDGCDCQVSLGDATHWRPIQNPPPGQLPAPLERLGEVLRKVKGVS